MTLQYVTSCMGSVITWYHPRAVSSNICDVKEVSGGTATSLRGTLHSLSAGWDVVVIFIHSSSAMSPGLLISIDGVEREIFDHGVGWRHGTRLRRRQNTVEFLNFRQITKPGRWEFDIELDIKIAKVVVAV